MYRVKVVYNDKKGEEKTFIKEYKTENGAVKGYDTLMLNWWKKWKESKIQSYLIKIEKQNENGLWEWTTDRVTYSERGSYNFGNR